MSEKIYGTAIEKLKQVRADKRYELNNVQEKIRDLSEMEQGIKSIIDELSKAIEILESQQGVEHDARSEETPRPDPV